MQERIDHGCFARLVSATYGKVEAVELDVCQSFWSRPLAPQLDLRDALHGSHERCVVIMRTVTANPAGGGVFEQPTELELHGVDQLGSQLLQKGCWCW
jgi:hypothetical protein